MQSVLSITYQICLLIRHRLSVTIMAPSPLVGALFICFERVSERLGSHYGRLPPKWCTFYVVFESSGILLIDIYRFEDIPHLCRLYSSHS